MLGNYSRNDLDCQPGERETEGDLESNRLQAANPAKENFRSLINTNSREYSEILAKKIARMINKEIKTQVTIKLDEIREDLNTQILEVINSAIAEKMVPSIQNVLGVQNSGITTRDHQYGGLDWSPKTNLVIWTTGPKD